MRMRIISTIMNFYWSHAIALQELCNEHSYKFSWILTQTEVISIRIFRMRLISAIMNFYWFHAIPLPKCPIMELIIKSKRFEDASSNGKIIQSESFNDPLVRNKLNCHYPFVNFVPFDYLFLPSLNCFSRPIPLAISLVPCGGMGWYLLSCVVCLCVCLCPCVYIFNFIMVCPCNFYFSRIW